MTNLRYLKLFLHSGLMLISKELGLDLPEIYSDDAWKRRY